MGCGFDTVVRREKRVMCDASEEFSSYGKFSRGKGEKGCPSTKTEYWHSPKCIQDKGETRILNCVQEFEVELIG